ncbi:MAG: FG-GAP repeat domain-containing protein [Planctomycetota bacterium]
MERLPSLPLPTSTEIAPSAASARAAIFDFNGDGLLDIVSDTAIRVQQGDSSFVPAQQPGIPGAALSYGGGKNALHSVARMHDVTGPRDHIEVVRVSASTGSSAVTRINGIGNGWPLGSASTLEGSPSTPISNGNTPTLEFEPFLRPNSDNRSLALLLDGTSLNRGLWLADYVAASDSYERSQVTSLPEDLQFMAVYREGAIGPERNPAWNTVPEGIAAVYPGVAPLINVTWLAPSNSYQPTTITFSPAAPDTSLEGLAVVDTDDDDLEYLIVLMRTARVNALSANRSAVNLRLFVVRQLPNEAGFEINSNPNVNQPPQLPLSFDAPLYKRADHRRSASIGPTRIRSVYWHSNMKSGPSSSPTASVAFSSLHRSTTL